MNVPLQGANRYHHVHSPPVAPSFSSESPGRESYSPVSEVTFVDSAVACCAPHQHTLSQLVVTDH